MDETKRERPAEAIWRAALEPTIVKARADLAAFTASIFKTVGTALQVMGHFVGPDRKSGASPFGHGDDAAVAVSVLLRIGSQLVSACADLIKDGRHYAGAALIRQLVEVEYLAWAFEAKNEVAAQWLRSSREERQSFFTPAKLRKAADDRFRSADYGHHCELGGHPVPGVVATAQRGRFHGAADALGRPGSLRPHLGSRGRLVAGLHAH